MILEVRGRRPRPFFQVRSSRPVSSLSSTRTNSRMRARPAGNRRARAPRRHLRAPRSSARSSWSAACRRAPARPAAPDLESLRRISASRSGPTPPRASRRWCGARSCLPGRPEVGDRLVGRELTEHRAALHRPDIELALHALGVGIERGAETALRSAHLGSAQSSVSRHTRAKSSSPLTCQPCR